MDSLQQHFDELRRRLKHGRGMDHASDDPVFYLLFKPEEMLTVKRCMKQWVAKLNIEGWKVHIFSMAEVVHQIFRGNDLRDIWLDSEQDAPLDFDSINETLADVLTRDNTLRNELEGALKTLKGQDNTVLFITDL